MSAGRIRASEMIASPPELVFRLLTDPSRAPEWDPKLKRVTQMTRGALRKGVIWRGTVEVDGQEYHSDDEVTEYNPPWRFALASVQGGNDSIAYSLTVEEHWTRVDVLLSYELPELLPGQAADETSIREELRRGLADSLGRLKSVAERQESSDTAD